MTLEDYKIQDLKTLREEMSKNNSEILVKRGDISLKFDDLTSITADEFINSCKVIIDGEKVRISKNLIRKAFNGEPTGRYGMTYGWRGTGCGLVEGSPSIDGKTGLDCTSEIYAHSLCWNRKTKSWMI